MHVKKGPLRSKKSRWQEAESVTASSELSSPGNGSSLRGRNLRVAELFRDWGISFGGMTLGKKTWGGAWEEQESCTEKKSRPDQQSLIGSGTGAMHRSLTLGKRLKFNAGTKDGLNGAARRIRGGGNLIITLDE